MSDLVSNMVIFKLIDNFLWKILVFFQTFSPHFFTGYPEDVIETK